MRYIAKSLSIIILSSVSAFAQAAVVIPDAFLTSDAQFSGDVGQAAAELERFDVPAPVNPFVEPGKDSSETADPYVYLPIQVRMVYEYEYTSSEFLGSKRVTVEYKGYSEKDSLTNASITYYNKNGVKNYEFQIKVNPNGLSVSDTILAGVARIEIPFPLFKGKEWTENSDKNRVSTFSAKTSLPAGNFAGCLRITTKLGGGDAGSAERIYAPGIGLVSETITAEDKQESLKLISFSTN